MKTKSQSGMNGPMRMVISDPFMESNGDLVKLPMGKLLIRYQMSLNKLKQILTRDGFWLLHLILVMWTKWRYLHVMLSFNFTSQMENSRVSCINVVLIYSWESLSISQAMHY